VTRKNSIAFKCKIQYILISISDQQRLITDIKCYTATNYFMLCNFLIFYIYFYIIESIMGYHTK